MGVMAKKKRKSNRKKGFNKILLLILVVIAFGIYKYHHDKAFRDSVDEVRTEIEQKIPEVIPEKTKEPSNADSKPKDKTKSEKSSAAEKSASTEKKPSSKSKKSGLVELPKGLEIPACKKNASGSHEIRNFSYYSVCYREEYEQAEWSAYMLSKEQLVKNSSRTNDFRPDPRISTDSATLDDYRGSGYDRGHLTPAADMSFDKIAMSETFYMSNMSPQAPAFNRGIWQQLEAQVRNWAKKFGRVYVVSGPVLEKSPSAYSSIGKNKITVPEYYYKVILVPCYADSSDMATPDDCANILAVGFLLPNDGCSGHEYWDYAVTVDSVEKRTGIDFFAALEKSVQDKAESEILLDKWR